MRHFFSAYPISKLLELEPGNSPRGDTAHLDTHLTKVPFIIFYPISIRLPIHYPSKNAIKQVKIRAQIWEREMPEPKHVQKRNAVSDELLAMSPAKSIQMFVTKDQIAIIYDLMTTIKALQIFIKKYISFTETELRMFLEHAYLNGNKQDRMKAAHQPPAPSPAREQLDTVALEVSTNEESDQVTQSIKPKHNKGRRRKRGFFRMRG